MLFEIAGTDNRIASRLATSTCLYHRQYLDSSESNGPKYLIESAVMVRDYQIDACIEKYGTFVPHLYL